MISHPPRLRLRRCGFTLVELMVAMAIFLVLLALLVGIIDAVSRVWVASNSRLEQFRESRRAMEIIRTQLAQATLGSYWDYEFTGTGASRTPTKYIRQSNLRFLSGKVSDQAFPAALFGSANPMGEPVGHGIFFNAPLGVVANQTFSNLPGLLNTLGFFVSYGEHTELLPDFIKTDPRYRRRERFRLFQMAEPSEKLTVYQYTSGADATSGLAKNDSYAGREWFTAPLANASNTRLVAENIVAVLFRPRLADGTQLANGTFTYDSTVTTGNATTNPKHQLPPVVELTLVAVDEGSAQRFPTKLTPAALSLSTRFQSPDSFETDIAALEAHFQQSRIQYRLFQTSVAILGAKWSTEQ